MFSVLMANYNQTDYLAESIRSVQNQTYQNWEIVFVDDASTDQSWDLVKDIARHEPRLKIFRHRRNQGCGATKNDCFQKAQGQLAGYLDPDDLLTPKALEIMVKQHQTHRTASLIYSQQSNFVNSHPESAQPTFSHQSLSKNSTYLTGEPYLIGHFATFKTKALHQAGGLNPNFHRAVDQDLYYRLEEQGSVFFIDQQLYLYRLHDRGLSTGDNGQNRGKAFYWHLKAAEEASHRRGLSPESVLANLINGENKSYYQARLLQNRLGRLLSKLSLLPQP